MKKQELEQEVLGLLNSQQHGMLSTFAEVDGDDKAAGFPFGSMVRFVICQSPKHRGLPLVMLSRIAEHSKHIELQTKVSLLVSAEDNETQNSDRQQVARLTVLGEMMLQHADDPDLQADAELYFQQFPESRDYFQLLDFDFYRLHIVKGRYIGGFARAHWLKGEQFLQTTSDA